MIASELLIKLKSQYESSGLTELKNALKENVQEMERLKQSGQQGSQQWNDAKSKAKYLSDEIKGLSREYKGLDSQVKMSKFQLLEFGENLTVVSAGLITALRGLKDLVSGMIMSGTELEVLRSNFQGTEQDLELFRKATAGTVNDGNLIKLSNQASDLGISLKDQALLFSLSEDAADKYGGSVTDNFQKVVLATEGNIKGLKALGIQKAVFNEKVKDMVKAMGGETEELKSENGEREITIKNLDAETQKRIRTNAIIELTGINIDKVNSKTQDNKDKFEALQVAMENTKAKIGSFIANGLVNLASTFGVASKSSQDFAGTIAVMGTVAGGAIVPLVQLGGAAGQMAVAFPKAAVAVNTLGTALQIGLLAKLTIVLGVIYAMMDGITRLQNFAKGRGFTNDPLNDKDYNAEAKRQLDEEFGTKVKGKLKNEYYIPSAKITVEDIEIRAAQLKLKDTGKWNPVEPIELPKVPEIKIPKINGGKNGKEIVEEVNDVTEAYKHYASIAEVLAEAFERAAKAMLKINSKPNWLTDDNTIRHLSDDGRTSIEPVKEVKVNKDDSNNKPFDSINDSTSKISSIFSNMMTAINIGADTFVGKMVEGFQMTLGVIQVIMQTIQAIDAVKSIFPFIFGKASGGYISGSGTGTSDSIPAWLSNGEYVVNANATSKFLPLLQAINKNSISDYTNIGRYASGGIVNRQMAGNIMLEVADVKIKGSDLLLSWRRQNKLESGRLSNG